MALRARTFSKPVIPVIAALLVCCVCVTARAGAEPDVDREAITIWSQGVRLAGDIYKPKGLQPADQLPGILMVPGWGGSKKNLEKNYAPHFASQGFVVLTFDFKSWGESDGPLLASERLRASEEAVELGVNATHIRKVVNPLSMSEDVRAALYYLGSEPQVEPNTIGIWGTSMGGGLALVMAATDDRIKAVVDQIGSVNYQYNLRKIPEKKIRQAEAMVARGKLPPYPGPGDTPNSPFRGYPDWVGMKRFDPFSYVDRITVPTLIIDAQDETLFETGKNGRLLYETIKDRVESRYVTFPGGHYDMYKGENLRAARDLAARWFLEHLK